MNLSHMSTNPVASPKNNPQTSLSSGLVSRLYWSARSLVGEEWISNFLHINRSTNWSRQSLLLTLCRARPKSFQGLVCPHRPPDYKSYRVAPKQTARRFSIPHQEVVSCGFGRKNKISIHMKSPNIAGGLQYLLKVRSGWKYTSPHSRLASSLGLKLSPCVAE